MELLTIGAAIIVIILAAWPFITRKNSRYDNEWRENRKDIDKLPPMQHEGVDTHNVHEDRWDPYEATLEVGEGIFIPAHPSSSVVVGNRVDVTDALAEDDLKHLDEKREGMISTRIADMTPEQQLRLHNLFGHPLPNLRRPPGRSVRG